ncbi:MAG TPA: alpha/beta hydrolase [Actinomycetota bacterium]|nr:alpha/beta hydrolase [Actinomycetota bacterium]
MSRTIYRSDDGRAAIRSWCEQRLDASTLRGSTIETPAGPTFVATAGAGHDVVLLPGTNFATATWPAFVDALAATGRVTAADLPGQPGLSADERPARDAYATWLRHVIRERALDRPVVVGHSLGALVGLSAASGSTDVGGLVLVSAAGLLRLRVTTRLLADSARWVRRKDDPSSARLLERMTGPSAAPPDHLTGWMTLVARHVRSSLAPRPLPAATLASVRCPVHVVTGTDDVFLSARKVGAAAAAIAGPTVATEVPSAGHLLPFEQPEVIVAAVRDTIRLVRAASGRAPG